MNGTNFQGFENQEAVPDIDAADNKANTVYTDLRDYDVFECVFAWLCILIGYLFCCAFPASSFPLGTFIVSILCVAATIVTLAKKNAKIGVTEWLLALTSVGFSFTLLLNSDTFPTFIAIICALISFCFFVYRASGNRVGKGNSDFLPIELLRSLKGFSIYAVSDMFRIMFARRNKSFKAVLKILIGLIAAVIPTAIVISLLSYDGRFSELLRNAFSFIIDFDFREQIIYLSFGIVIAMYIFGVYAINTSDRKPINCDAMRERSDRVRVAPVLTVSAALLPLLVVYSFFFISQWDYYVSGFSGKLPEGVVNYAEYARSGFFELCTVSAINLAIIVIVALFTRRKNNGEKLFLRIVSAAFSIMTLVLIGTALSKMALYIGKFGLTEKRVLASWLMVVIAFIFIFIVIRCFIKSFRLFFASTLAVVLMCGVLILSDYNAIIANYNVERYISGESETIDTNALVNGGTSAVPAIVRLMEHCKENKDDGSLYYQRLEKRIAYEKARLEVQNDIFSFSLPNYRSKNAVEEFLKDNTLNVEYVVGEDGVIEIKTPDKK